MYSEEEAAGRRLLVKWSNNSALIRISLKYAHVRAARVIRARIDGFSEGDRELVLQAEEGDEIRLDLYEARFDDVVTEEGLRACNLDPSKYPESLSLKSELFQVDLFGGNTTQGASAA